MNITCATYTDEKIYNLNKKKTREKILLQQPRDGDPITFVTRKQTNLDEG